MPYRLFFLLVEPLATLAGAYFAFFDQRTYLDLTHASSAPSPIPLGTSIAMSQLANLYFAFALSEALVLRSTSDLRVWKAVLFCLLVADFGHLYTVRVLGPQISTELRQGALAPELRDRRSVPFSNNKQPAGGGACFGVCKCQGPAHVRLFVSQAANMHWVAAWEVL
jgi:hypothetical protein